jgi:hypothetical protein
MFSAISRLALEGFSCNFIPHTFCACPVNDASLVILGRKLRPLYLDKKLHFQQSWPPLEGFSWNFRSQTLHTSATNWAVSVAIGHKWIAFGKHSTLSAVSQLSVGAFSCNFTHYSIHTCSTDLASLIVVGPYLMALYLKDIGPFWLCLRFQFRNCTENSYLTFSMHALQMMQDWFQFDSN